jgi:protein TonB
MSENKEINPGVESFDEIVFEHRNKEYGAYYLRKKYKVYVFFAFWVAALVVSTAVLTPLIASYYNREKYVKKIDKTVTAVMEKVNEEEAPPPPPPPPPPAEAIQQAKFTAPVVVDTVKEEVKIATADDMKSQIQPEAPPAELTMTEKKEEVIEKEEPVFLVVEENATFQGGDINSFNTWVKQNVAYPSIAAENNIQGRVVVQFAVNSKGEIVDVKVVRGIDRALDDEAIRVIKSSPKWTPGKQGGKSVKQQFTIPIVFQLQTN